MAANLNPVDYKVWGILGHAARMNVQDKNQGHVHELRYRIVDECDRHLIDKAVGEWRKTSSLCGCRRRTVWT